MIAQPIASNQLEARRMPVANASLEAIWRFALTFDGYAHCGSLEACAAVAEARQHDTIDDLRTCLFWEQRRWRYAGEAPDQAGERYVRELLALIRNKLNPL